MAIKNKQVRALTSKEKNQLSFIRQKGKMAFIKLMVRQGKSMSEASAKLKNLLILQG